MGQRLRALDGLRGVAVCLVLVYHYTAGFEHVVGPHAPGLLFRFPAGALGVNLFFLISGYVILMTAERVRSVREFALGRFARLYPPFLVAVLLTGTILCTSGFNPLKLAPAQVPLNLVMATYLLGIVQVDSVYWTLSYEIVFYILIAVTVIGLGIRRVELLGLAWLLVAFGVKFVLKVPPPPGIHPAFALPIVTVSEFAYLFVAGMMIRRLHTGQGGWLAWVVLGCCAFPVLVPLLQVLRGTAADRPAVLAFVALSLAFAALVYLAPRHRIPLLSAGALPFLGDISYSLYLIHQMPGYWVIALLEARGVNPNLAALVTGGLAIGLATLMRRTIEQPAQRALRRMLMRPAVQPVGA